MILNKIFSWFENRVNPYPKITRDIPMNSFIHFLLFSVKGVKGWLFFFILLGIFLGAFEAYLFQMMGWLVDALNNGNPETFWTDNHILLIFFIVMILASVFFKFLQGLIHFQTLIGALPMRLRWWFHHMIMGQSIGFFQDELAGRISAKVMQTSLAVREIVFSFTEMGVYIAVYFLTVGLILSGFDSRLLIPFSFWLILMSVVMYIMVPKIGKVTELQADARSIMTGRITDTYSNIQTVKLFSQNKNESEYSKEAMNGFLKTVHQQMRLVNILNVMMNAINMGLILIVSTMGIVLWRYGLVSVGAVSVSIAFALRLNNMAFWIMFEAATLFENIGVAKDGMNTFAIQPEVVDVPNAKELVVVEGAVNYKNVFFSYNAQGKPIFTNFNLNIQGREKIGLVGRSGSGKSTLINLLLRFYDIDSGVISIDNQDISLVTQESLRCNIGMVTQDTSLLHRSIKDNIRYAVSHATEEEIIRVAKQAQADDFICDLTDKYGHTGYDTLVGERGVKLSGGQRQRVSIARVLLKNAPILILDEATSALDSEVEAAIQDTLQDLMKNKTVIAIAHRLSTIAAMDRLIVMDEGQIVEMGSHQELLDKGGLYAQLWLRQSGGFLLVE